MDTLILANAMLFLSTLSLRRATSTVCNLFLSRSLFLSTLSLRRATLAGPSGPAFLFNFYPRSPCGERPRRSAGCSCRSAFLSTLSLRRATDVIAEMTEAQSISIHALLAESDYIFKCSSVLLLYFYPRSPCGERRWLLCYMILARLYFYPRSPCGERPISFSAGRGFDTISIHALLAESDRYRISARYTRRISIHALLAESDEPATSRNNKNNIFLSTLSLRRATTGAGVGLYLVTISIHALLAESDGQ